MDWSDVFKVIVLMAAATIAIGVLIEVRGNTKY